MTDYPPFDGKVRTPFRLERADGISIVGLPPTVDLYNDPEFRQTLLDEIEHEATAAVAIDFSETGSFDTSALGTVVGGLLRAKKLEKPLTLRGLEQPAVIKTFETTGLIRIFPVDQD